MRNPRINGVVVSSALVASLVGGVLGATSASADAPTSPAAVTKPAAPAASAVLAQAQQLNSMSSVIAPVSDLVAAALANPAAPDVAKINNSAAAVKKAIDAAKGAKAGAPAVAAPAAPAAAPAVAPAHVPAAAPAHAAALPGHVTSADKTTAAPAAPRDVRAEALTALQSSTDALVKASATKNAPATAAAANKVIAGMVNVAVATVLAPGLPKPDLAGLPALPAMPGAPAAAAAPVAAPAAPSL